MSNTAINAVKWCSKSKGGARLVLLLIADGVSKDSDVYLCKTETLQHEANYDRRFVQRLIDKLIPTGELVEHEHGNRPSAFQIPILEGEPGYAPEDCPEFGSEAPEHRCSGRHTPLHVNREEQHSAAFGTGALTRKSKAPPPPPQRSIDRPKVTKASRSGLLTASQRSIDRPRSGLLTASQRSIDRPLPSVTPSVTRRVPGDAPTISFDTWIAEPERRELRMGRMSAKIVAYRVWCQQNGLAAEL